ncbi:SurA N-terminal domain-containing protein [Nonomuraea indica]|uniref:SurA N-terminal domain-containing protein n=1 Tax=Nonomuraea indica TaxID=1581193 RepID=UPI000C7A9ADB|nr:SurA N-terminal domain-containing protein [Nonomuraea indica]
MKSIRAAVAAAAVGASLVALTACSSPMEAGAAAVVGGERISASDLNRNVQEYEAALKRAGIQPDQLPAPITQFVLTRMANQSAFEQLAAKHNIKVSEAEVDNGLKDPGQYQSPEINLLAKGVSPADARAYLRAELGVVKLQRQFGGPEDQNAQARLQQEFGAIKMVYSPRYGQFTNEQGFVDTGRFGKLVQQNQQPAQG